MESRKTSSSLRAHQLVGLVLIAILFAGLGGWAAFTSINGAVIAQAKVIVETNAKKVQHQEGGIVSEILVKEGERVKAGDVILRLDQTETHANLAIIDAQLNEFLARKARLEAERDQADTLIFPQEITGSLSDPHMESVRKGQQNLFAARREAKQGEQAQLKFKIDQLGEEIRGLEAQKSSKEQQLLLIKQELDALKGLKEKGLVTINRILALERELAKLEGEHGELIAHVARKRGEIGETRLRIIQIDKDLNSEIITELRDAQTKIAEFQQKRLAAETRLKRTEVRAPRSGIVYQLNVHTVGGVIAAGDVIMLIVPEKDKLVFEASVAPSDIDQVTIGQKATLRLHAFNTAITPVLIGKVFLISADAIVDEGSGTTYYRVRIKVSNNELAKLKGRTLVPGMLAEAFMQTQLRTVLSYFMKPLIDRIAHALRER